MKQENILVPLEKLLPDGAILMDWDTVIRDIYQIDDALLTDEYNGSDEPRFFDEYGDMISYDDYIIKFDNNADCYCEQSNIENFYLISEADAKSIHRAGIEDIVIYHSDVFGLYLLGADFTSDMFYDIKIELTPEQAWKLGV